MRVILGRFATRQGDLSRVPDACFPWDFVVILFGVGNAAVVRRSELDRKHAFFLVVPWRPVALPLEPANCHDYGSCLVPHAACCLLPTRYSDHCSFFGRRLLSVTKALTPFFSMIFSHIMLIKSVRT